MQVRVGGEIFHHATDLKGFGFVFVEDNYFSERIFVWKIFVGHFFGEHDGHRFRQSIVAVAIHHGDFKNVEKLVVGIGEAFFKRIVQLILTPDQIISGIEPFEWNQSSCFLHFGIIFFKNGVDVGGKGSPVPS